ncbi:hypothetical protein B0O80DRAFT_488182 [Mortierella sp. GBAus27b]|nr:hypothetical protein B0O80DRAFT_488182 [Mortierella sp. GBAus27b]
MFQRPAVTHRISYVLRKDESRNAHLLGVNALALDTSTPSVNSPPHPSGHDDDVRYRRRSKYRVPGGILYTGGRDGMIAAWDLHLESPVPRDIPGETLEQPKGLQSSTFRQSFNHHTDWVNDIVLCHNGETLVSASSDRTVKLVRPHSHNPSSAHIIGTHGDYVKTLAYASGPGWVASGGLDKTVNLWDIKEGRSGQFLSLGSIPETSSKASIYALACNPAGNVLATGSPEKIIRVWDPRSGQRITKFAGHTDNIRALLISESGDAILSASSDTTIKLWSLKAQRCITTFTMHSDSVWSLYSDHPELATFYGGGKDGLVTKTEVNRYNHQLQDDYENEDPGQCVVICKADAGIARLIAHEDARIWTATSSSSVYQWPDIPTRANRSQELAESIVPANLLKMNLNDSSYTEHTQEHGYPMSTVYSAASVGSIFANNRDRQSQHSSEDDDGLITPIFEEPENIIEGEHGLIKHALLNNRRMAVTEDKCGEVALWDIIKCVQLETFPGRKMNEVVNELNTIESVPTWCTIDTRIGALTIHLDDARCFDAEVYLDEIDTTPDPERADDQRVSIGKWVLKNLFAQYVPVHIEAYEKEEHRIQHQNDQQAPTGDMNEGTGTKENDTTTGAGSSGPGANTSEGLKGPLSTSEPPATSAVASPNPQDNTQQAQAGSTPANSSKQSTTPSTASSKPSNSGSAPPSGASTPSSTMSPTPANSSSSNGLMGRLKHSVKKLARTPSAEQKFENGRSSRKISISTGSGNPVSKAPNSPSIPESPSPSLSTTVSGPLPTASGTGVSSSTASSSPRTTMMEGASGLESQAPGALKVDDDQSTSDATSSHSDDSIPSPVMQLPTSTISVRPPHPPFSPPTAQECPPIAIPPHVPVIISEQSREASSSVDLYRGSVGTLGSDYVPLVQVIPTWLLEVVLKGLIPMKEPTKVSFVLRPHHSQEGPVGTTGAGGGGLSPLGELPGGNPRLTAPRMLRVRKVIGHVVEKLALSPPEWILVSTANIVTGALGIPYTTAGQNDNTQSGGHHASAQSNEPQDHGASDGPLSSTLLIPPPTNSNSSDNNTSDPSGGQAESRPAEESITPLMSKSQEEEDEEEYVRQRALRPENWVEVLCNDQVLAPTTTLATIRAHYWKSGSDVVLTYRYKQPTTTTTTTAAAAPSGVNASAGASTSTLAVTTGSLHSATL